MKMAFRKIFLSLWLAFGALLGLAAAPAGGWLNADNPRIEGQFVVVNYTVAFDGVSEFRLFDAEGNLVWRNQTIDEAGPNVLRLKASAFNPGKGYTLQINYKREQVRLPLSLPGS
jgi:hypothetical protein